MRSSIAIQAILAVGALSSPLRQHVKKELTDWVTDVDVVTVVDYVSIGSDGLPTPVPVPSSATPTTQASNILLGSDVAPSSSPESLTSTSSSSKPTTTPSVISSIAVLATTASAFATTTGSLSLTLPAPTFGADPIPLSSISALASSIASSISVSSVSASIAASSSSAAAASASAASLSSASSVEAKNQFHSSEIPSSVPAQTTSSPVASSSSSSSAAAPLADSSAPAFVSTSSLTFTPKAGSTFYPSQMATPIVVSSAGAGKPKAQATGSQSYVDLCKTPSASLPALATPTGDSLSDWLLYYHNVHRRNHSAPDMIWSTQLELDAMVQVGQHNTTGSALPNCTGGHVMDINHDSYGQNIAGASGGGSGTAQLLGDVVVSNAEIARSATNMWYAEADAWGPSNYGKSLQENHFTQMVWKESTLLGCGVQQCGYDAANGHGSGYWISCDYLVEGNNGDTTQVDPPLCHPPIGQDPPKSN